MSEGFATSPLPAGTVALVQGAASGAGVGAGTGGAGGGGTVALPNPPPALAALSAGQAVRAVVVGRNAEGKVVVETRFGQIALDLPVNPQRGSVLQFQIQRSGDPVQLRLVLPVSSQAQGQGQGGPLLPGAGGETRPLRTGDTITVQRLTAGATPTEGAPRQVRVAAMAAPGARLPAASAPAGGGTGAPMMSVRVVPPPAGSPPGTPVIVQGDAGRFALPGIARLEPGTQLLLSLTGHTAAPGSLPAARPQLTALGSAWAALDDAHAALQSADAGAGTSVAAAAIPQTGPRLTAGILFFLTALARGRIEDWLGRDAVRTLDSKENRHHLTRLTDDFTRLARAAAEPAQGDWRTLMLPLLHDGVLQQIRLYLRDNPGEYGGEGGDGEEQPGTRFVVEAALSRLGPLQLDGLVRPKRFDLMVRTHAALPAEVRDGITDLFAEANRGFNARGRIGFQVEDPFTVHPDAEGDTHATGVMA